MSDTTVVIYIVVSMIILLIISLSVLWFFYHSQNKIMKLKMQEQENKIVYHKNLLLNTVKTQENERNRIASDLHDDVASKLNVVHLNIHLLKKKLAGESEIEKIIDQIETSLQDSIHRTRMISYELMPQMLKKFGFHFAIHELSQTINATGSIHMDIRNIHMCEIRDNFKVLHLYRVLQELVNNTLKYAKAQNIEITFHQTGNDIIMDYTDDGIGFQADQPSMGLGLYNIKTRSELLHGEWKFLNDKNQPGCHFTLKFSKDA